MKPQSIEELRSVNDMLSLKGKVALVTGAAGGIGRSTAAAFAELGAKVALMDIPAREDMLRQNVADINELYGGEAMYVTGDVSIPNPARRSSRRLWIPTSTITFHNNAGVGGMPDEANMPLDAWYRVVGINMTGCFVVARTCARIMKEHGHGGAIVSTASMSGVIINTGPAYAATKAAVRHMTAALAMEYAKDNIRCNSVCYGYILSGLHEGFKAPDGSARSEDAIQEGYQIMAAKTPMGRMVDLSEAVGAVVYLASDLTPSTPDPA
jgi:NAD(P)-dependent dehydrogenase (short-subunit alcohol dehydrogenase family)